MVVSNPYQDEGRTIKPKLPDMIIFTNASRWGWGAKSENVRIGGAWNSKEQRIHMNCLGVIGCLVRNTSLCSMDRQSVSYGLHKSHGRYSLQQFSRSCNSVLELGPGEGDLSSGEAHCRKRKCVSTSFCPQSLLFICQALEIVYE